MENTWKVEKGLEWKYIPDAVEQKNIPGVHADSVTYSILLLLCLNQKYVNVPKLCFSIYIEGHVRLMPP